MGAQMQTCLQGPDSSLGLQLPHRGLGSGEETQDSWISWHESQLGGGTGLLLCLAVQWDSQPGSYCSLGGVRYLREGLRVASSQS